jgi:hypothetical protein
MVFFVVAALQLGYLAGLHAERGAKNEELIYIFDGVDKKKKKQQQPISKASPEMAEQPGPPVNQSIRGSFPGFPSDSI